MAFSLKTKLLSHQEQTRAFALDKQFIFDLSRPGTGKSLSFLSLVVEVKKKAVVACPPHLVNNWLAEVAKHTNLKASPHLLKFNPEYDLFVVPYTKIKDAEDIFKNVEIVGLDECFHESQKIITSRGTIPIKEVVVGDMVKNCLGWSRVSRVINQGPKEVQIHIVFEDDTLVVTTENHPFLTNSGWVTAGSLKERDEIITSREAMRVVQGSIPSEETLKKVLLKEMQCEKYDEQSSNKGDCNSIQNRSPSTRCEEAYARIKSHEEPIFKREGHNMDEELGTQTANSGREWERDDSSSETTSFGASKDRLFLDIRRDNTYERSAERYATSESSESLQGGPISLSQDAGGGVGWGEPQLPRKESPGQEERALSRSVRIKSITIHKRGSSDQYLKGDFYDLSVDSHPSFSLENGAMVHNCQYVKNLEAKRTRAVHTMLYKYTPKYFVGMTGTILKNRVPELYSPLILLGLGEKVEKKIIERYKSFYVFCNRFCNVKQTPFGNSYSGVKNLEELRSYLVPYSIKHTEDVLNLPELKETEVVVNYKDDPELMQAFLEFQDRGIRLESGAKAKSAEASAPFTASLVQSLLDQDAGPIVVFSDHPKALNLMELELSTKRVRVISGATGLDKRTEYVKMLNTGQLDVLLCSTGSSSSGLTMTGSSTLIVNDPPFVPGDYEQLVKRVHRLSQEKECRIIKVLGSEVVGKIYKMLDAKNKTINKVTEGI